jgi:hypothetical protein
MSVFDSMPPNTRAANGDDDVSIKGDAQTNPQVLEVEQAELFIDREAYKREVPLWRRIWQHSMTQMVLLSIQAFCGPAMADAIAGEWLHHPCRRRAKPPGLGGGGLATPQTSNIATAINYTMLATVCMFGGPLVNKLGTKWALVIGACSFPIRGSSYYCNSMFGNQWYLILGESPGLRSCETC